MISVHWLSSSESNGFDSEFECTPIFTMKRTFISFWNTVPVENYGSFWLLLSLSLSFCALIPVRCIFRYAAQSKKGRFPERNVSKYILQLTSALMYIHKKNVIHRDIKPENLLLDCDDNLKLCDFGWSIHYDRKRPDVRRDTFCGTMAYIAPEMLNSAQHNSQHDVYVDVWALGVLTFELILGSAPFEDSGSATPGPSQTQSILSQDISKAAKQSKLRYHSHPSLRMAVVI